MTAIAAPAAMAKFKIASLSCPNAEVTNPCIQAGNFFDCRILSITILIGHGSRTSLNVSPNTATNARVSAFQCGQIRPVMLNSPGRFERVAFGLLPSMFSFVLRPAFPILNIHVRNPGPVTARNLCLGGLLYDFVLLFRSLSIFAGAL